MTQRYPLPLTAAMLAKSNAHEGKPRYDSPANVAADWAGGGTGNEADVATPNVAIASSASAALGTVYVPRHQTEKGTLMVPLRTILADIGKDYGTYTGAAGRDGTIQPRQPYPAVKP